MNVRPAVLELLRTDRGQNGEDIRRPFTARSSTHSRRPSVIKHLQNTQFVSVKEAPASVSFIASLYQVPLGVTSPERDTQRRSHSPVPCHSSVTSLWRWTRADIVTALARMCEVIVPGLIFRRPAVTLYANKFNAKNFTFCARSAFMCLVCKPKKKKKLFFPTHQHWLVFITEAKCVHCAVRTEYLNVFQVNLNL